MGSREWRVRWRPSRISMSPLPTRLALPNARPRTPMPNPHRGEIEALPRRHAVQPVPDARRAGRAGAGLRPRRHALARRALPVGPPLRPRRPAHHRRRPARRRPRDPRRGGRPHAGGRRRRRLRRHRRPPARRHLRRSPTPRAPLRLAARGPGRGSWHRQLGRASAEGRAAPDPFPGTT